MKATHRWSAACCAVAALVPWPAISAETPAPAPVVAPAPTIAPTPAVAPTPAPTATVAPVKSVDAARIRLSGVQAAVAALEAQIAIPTPRGLTVAQLAEWKEHGTWLASLRERYANFLAENGGAFGDSAGVTGTAGEDLTKKMAQMNMQFLALQEATQTESRKFQALSNASKARHEAAMSAIRNIK
jgi:hypothetical protein